MRWSGIQLRRVLLHVLQALRLGISAYGENLVDFPSAKVISFKVQMWLKPTSNIHLGLNESLELFFDHHELVIGEMLEQVVWVLLLRRIGIRPASHTVLTPHAFR